MVEYIHTEIHKQSLFNNTNDMGDSMVFFDSYLDTVSYEMYGKTFIHLNNSESLYVTAKINMDVIIHSNLKDSLYDNK